MGGIANPAGVTVIGTAFNGGSLGGFCLKNGNFIVIIYNFNLTIRLTILCAHFNIQ
jgi:hypothetical protein